MKAEKAKVGRPTLLTQELADEICGRIIESDYGLEQVCEAEDMPAARTVYRWLASNKEFRQQYTRAKEDQGHVQADRGTRDALKATDAALGRLHFDARKWQASKLASRQYGDKVAVVGGGPDDRPVRLDVHGMTPDQIASEIAALEAEAAAHAKT